MADDAPMYGPFFGVMGATAAVVSGAMGAAYGTAKSSNGIAAMAVLRTEDIMKFIIPVVIACIIAIYGVVVAVLIASDLKAAPEYKLYTGVVHLVASLAAGYAVGIVGDAGV